MKKRALSLVMALVMACCLACPASAEFALFSPPAETSYWHNLSTADANQLLNAMYQGTATKNSILIYYSLGCGYCAHYIPQYADYVNNEGIEVSAYGETAPGYSTLLFTPDMLGGSNTVGWPCIFTYNASEKRYGFAGSVHSLDDFKAFLDGQGLLTPSEPPRPTIFTDVPQGAWYADAVAWAVAASITNGTGNNTFSPSRPCTRAQIVTFLWRAAGRPQHTISNPFTDVSPAMGSDYYNAILWAVENNITNGMGAGTFSPNASCTRAQAVTFLGRVTGQPAPVGDNIFYDVGPDMLPDFRNAIIWATEYGITHGTNEAFLPNDTCTRAHIVTFLHRAA